MSKRGLIEILSDIKEAISRIKNCFVVLLLLHKKNILQNT